MTKNTGKASSPGLIALLERNGVKPLSGSTENIAIVKTSELALSKFSGLCGDGDLSLVNIGWIKNEIN